MRLLGTWLRWHGWREQELDQDSRRRDRSVRPGILRLRLKEVGFGDDLAFAVWTGADSRAVSRRARPFRGLPPVPVSRTPRRAQTSHAWRGLSPQRELRSRRRLASATDRRAGDDSREAVTFLRHRRECGRP